jgi:aspartate/methionine/tyrosine aminotransferase
MMIIHSDINFFDNRFLMFVLDYMAYEYEEAGKQPIRLTLGKSELPVHPDINQAIIDALNNFKRSALVFPAGLPELKERLSRHYQEKYNLDINPQNIIISVGTSTIFRNLFYLFLEKGDEVLLPLPYYSLYHFSALLAGSKIRYYKIDLDTLKLDRQSFAENFTDRTRLVVINSPGNPLGNILSKEELYFMDSVVEGRAPIINDEVYDNVCFDEQSPSVMELNHTKSVFITTNSFSKAYRMYSRRVGYCIVPDELITPLRVIQDHTLLTTDPVCQFGALKALDYQHEVEYLKNLYKGRRDYTLGQFKDVADVRAIPSRGSFYLTLDCERYMKKNGLSTSLQLATGIMEEKMVATVPGSDFGLSHTLRLSFSSSRFNEGIDYLVDFFNSNSR